MSSSSDEEQVKYEEVTDLKKVKELEKKAKKTAITPVIIEDDRHQTKPVMIAISEKDQKTKKDEGPDKKKTKEEKYENQQSRKGTNKPKQETKKLLYKEKNGSENEGIKKDNEKRPKYEEKQKYEEKKQQKVQKYKQKQKSATNLLQVYYNDSIQEIIVKVQKMIKENQFIVLSGVGPGPIEKTFLVVEEMHKLYKDLKRINIPTTIKEQGKTIPKIKIQLSLNELNEQHMGYQTSKTMEKDRNRNSNYSKNYKKQKFSRRNNRAEGDSDDERDYR